MGGVHSVDEVKRALTHHHNTFMHKRLDPFPSDLDPPIYDQLYGFPGGRKIREPIATEEECDSAKIDLNFRDYCAHKYLAIRTCLRDHQPWGYLCQHERHAFEECQYQDVIHDMKEWERERRLMLRDRRKQKMKEKLEEEFLKKA